MLFAFLGGFNLQHMKPLAPLAIQHILFLAPLTQLLATEIHSLLHVLWLFWDGISYHHISFTNIKSFSGRVGSVDFSAISIIYHSGIWKLRNWCSKTENPK